MEIISSILCSIAATFLYDTGNNLYNKIFDGFKGDKDFEKLVWDSFCKAVNHCVKNEQITQYYIDHDFEKYKKALKNELLLGYLPLTPEKLDQNVLTAFMGELDRQPEFRERLLVTYGKICIGRLAEIGQLMNEAKALNQQFLDAIIQFKETLDISAVNSEFRITLGTQGGVNGASLLPPNLIKRTLLVEFWTKNLLEHHSIYIYGNILSGKSTTAYLITLGLTDYTKAFYFYNYQNLYNLESLVANQSKDCKIVFVLDAIPYEDEAIVSAFFQLIEMNCNGNWLFIVTSRHQLSNYTMMDLSLFEYEMPMLTMEETNELFTKSESTHWATTLCALSNGHPLLLNCIIYYMEQNNWNVDNDHLMDLLSFPKNCELKTKLRKIIRHNTDAESLRLLNRLMLIQGTFTEGDCVDLAAVSQGIESPRTQLDKLMDKWVSKVDDKSYRISPLLKQTTVPDLLKQEESACCQVFVRHILQKKALTPLDISQVLILLLNASDYDNAGCFYINCINKLYDNKLLDHNDFFLFRKTWIDLPLPKDMSNDMQIAVRTAQLIFLGIYEKENVNYIVNDLKKLIENTPIKSPLLGSTSYVLSSYFLLLSDVESSLFYREIAKDNSPNIFENSKQSEEEVCWLTLHHSKTIENLYLWFDYYLKLGSPTWDLFGEVCLQTLINVINEFKTDSEKITALEMVLETVQTKSVSLYPFAVSAYYLLILHCSKESQYDKSMELYDKSKSLYNEDFAKLLLNYAMALELEKPLQVAPSVPL